MGLYPCSLCSRRFRGPAQTVYPSVLDGTRRLSSHLRLCPGCWDEFLDKMTAHALQLGLDSDDDLAIQLCVACGDTLGSVRALQVFVTSYPRGEDRTDYLGAAHPLCLGSLSEDWRLREAA